MVTLIVFVRDKATNRPLPWVSVEVNGASASTDAQGQRAFNVQPNIPLLIKVRAQAYGPWTSDPTGQKPEKTIIVPPKGAKVTIGISRALL